MIAQIYTILFVVAFLMLIYILREYDGHISVYYVMHFTSIFIGNLGYMQISTAKDLQSALYANQICYVGSCFTPIFLVLCIADLCKTRIPRVIQTIFMVSACTVFALVSTIGMQNWYYRSVTLKSVGGISYLEKVNGPLHNLFIVYLAAAFLTGLYIVIRSFASKKDVSYINSILLLVLMSCAMGAYAYERITHLEIELMAIIYVIAEFLILLMLKRIRLYDVASISASSMTENKVYGFVLCRGNGKYLGSDEVAKEWFPELAEQSVDRSIKAGESDFLHQVETWLAHHSDEQTMYFQRDNRIIEAQHICMDDVKIKHIHCVYLRDDTKQQEYTKLVESFNETLERDVNEKTKKMRKIQEDIIISMASIVENRDNNTGGHIARTSDIVKIFVKHLSDKKLYPDVTTRAYRCIIKAAPLHDFGKIAIPDVILNKPGKFTDEEYEEMKKHSEKGAVIVERILQNSEDEEFKLIAVNVAHFHHEKWDGNGYPTKIKGEEIPFEARVMALADVFDALVSKRVYKDSFSYDKAFQIIEESSGTHFDPQLCSEFLECRKQLEALYNSYDA